MMNLDFAAEEGRMLRYLIPKGVKNPIGFAKRMLLSNSPEARFALYARISAILVSPLDILMQPIEKKLYHRSTEPVLPMIFVVGPPRSGTTLLYQLLVNHLPVCYINNLTVLFPRSPVYANVLLHRFLRNRQDNYSSYYGNTKGYAGPHEGGHIWEKWFEEHHYLAPEQMDESVKENMGRFFAAYQSAFGKPFITKNGRNAVRIVLLAEVFKTARFIQVHRNPVFVAQSILKGRMDLHGNKNIPWTVRPKEYDEQKHYIDQVCEQVFFIEKQIEEDKQKIGKQKFLEVDYEFLCQEPREVVKKVSEEILNEQVNDIEGLRKKLKPFPASKGIKVSIEDYQAICDKIKQLYGDKAF